MTITDLVYVSMTVAFFAAMIAYVRACVGLGQADPDAAESEGAR